MDSVELHSAFHWTCHECATQNWIQAIVGDIDEAAFNSAENSLTGEPTSRFEGVMPDGVKDGEMAYIEELVHRIALTPKTVKCVSCGTVYESTIPFDSEL